MKVIDLTVPHRCRLSRWDAWLPDVATHALVLMHPGSGPSDRANDVFIPPIHEGIIAAGSRRQARRARLLRWVSALRPLDCDLTANADDINFADALDARAIAVNTGQSRRGGVLSGVLNSLSRR